MKKHLLLMASAGLFAVVALCSCDKGGEDDGGGTGGLMVDNKITVNVGNSYNGEIDAVKAMIYHGENAQEIAAAAFGNGEFTLNFPATVSDAYLSLVWTGAIPAGITLSNPNAKIADVPIYAYKSGNRVGTFYHGTSDWEGMLMYVNADCSITGSYIAEDGVTTYTYSNLHLKQGWNYAYKTKKDGVVTYTSQVPAGAQWHYLQYPAQLEP
ncbi:MAG: hypothetical protein LBF69_03665 [Prevotellaceae bacterium]|nr:hypothetical protein [Prevotellaceae bacterium]